MDREYEKEKNGQRIGERKEWIKNRRKKGMDRE